MIGSASSILGHLLPQDPEDAPEYGGRFLQLMLVDSDHAEAHGPQLPPNPLVSGQIVRTLAVPESGVGSRPRIAPGTGVPEATVHKNSYPISGEAEIGPPRQWKVSAPSRDPIAAEQPRERNLRGLVARRPDEAHSPAPL